MLFFLAPDHWWPCPVAGGLIKEEEEYVLVNILQFLIKKVRIFWQHPKYFCHFFVPKTPDSDSPKTWIWARIEIQYNFVQHISRNALTWLGVG